jgi:FkbH-like protein
MSSPKATISSLQQHLIDPLKPADYMALARQINEVGAAADLHVLRVAILSTCFINFVDSFLVVEGARQGLAIRTYYGAFGQFEQELADSQSALYQFDPQVLVLVMRPEDVEPDAVVRYYASQGRRFATLSRTLRDRLGECIRLFRVQSSAPVLVANFAIPAELPLRVFDANAADSLTYAIEESNRALLGIVAAHALALIWDYAGIVRAYGATEWTDRRLWSLARSPISVKHQPVLAKHLVRAFCGFVRPPAKCLVLDLDNTLWGGVVADDGLEGIQISDDYPGIAFKMFQRAVLGLRDRGILLAIASKNLQEVAEQVFREHPEMLLRWDDFAAVRINWEPKSKNLREIAAELNISPGALVLFDDNPVERAEVRANLPEVDVIEVPSDPLQYESALFECISFDAVTLTSEDFTRSELYCQERKRHHLHLQSTGIQEFLESLEMTCEVGHVGPSTLGRITQLVNKTNQFNTTTRRYNSAEIEEMGKSVDHVVAWLRLGDRFGDAGMVGVGILRREGELCKIDSFLMSCRVMGRKVEQAFLAYLVEEARNLGCTQLIGEYLPTKSNGMVKGLFLEMGFQKRAEVNGTGMRYGLDLLKESVEWPAVIRREPRCAAS